MDRAYNSSALACSAGWYFEDSDIDQTRRPDGGPALRCQGLVFIGHAFKTAYPPGGRLGLQALDVRNVRSGRRTWVRLGSVRRARQPQFRDRAQLVDWPVAKGRAKRTGCCSTACRRRDHREARRAYLGMPYIVRAGTSFRSGPKPNGTYFGPCA
jgi:hypothetical protein